MCGAPSYMSPEMFIGCGHDEMTDWWAVGVTYYEMIYGVRPFSGGNMGEIKNNVLKALLLPPPYWPDS